MAIQIDARLDGERHSRLHNSLVATADVRLFVYFQSEAVPRAVGEILAKARFYDSPPGRIVDTARGNTGTRLTSTSRIGVFHGFVDRSKCVIGFSECKRPRKVGEVSLVVGSPVEEDQITFLSTVVRRDGVWIGRIGAERDDGLEGQFAARAMSQESLNQNGRDLKLGNAHLHMRKCVFKRGLRHVDCLAHQCQLGLVLLHAHFCDGLLTRTEVHSRKRRLNKTKLQYAQAARLDADIRGTGSSETTQGCIEAYLPRTEVFRVGVRRERKRGVCELLLFQFRQHDADFTVGRNAEDDGAFADVKVQAGEIGKRRSRIEERGIKPFILHGPSEFGNTILIIR